VAVYKNPDPVVITVCNQQPPRAQLVVNSVGALQESFFGGPVQETLPGGESVQSETHKSINKSIYGQSLLQ